jgi:putative thioredoxin
MVSNGAGRGMAELIDVTDAEFGRVVLERSRELPVVVDFWAEWCGPCRQLAPVLERLATEHSGQFLLAKVDVDACPATAQHYGVRSIPLVLGFRDAQVVAELSGAQPESVVRTFLSRILPTQADELAVEADALAEAGHARAAEERFERALSLESRHGRALLGLARLRADEGAHAEALELLARISADAELTREAERLAAELRTRAESHGDEQTLRRRLEAAPGDLNARLDLGRTLAAEGRHEEALEALVEVIRADPAHAEEAARKTMLDVFEVLGAEHPLTARFRRELARALFR